jgi:hypothetical protein
LRINKIAAGAVLSILSASAIVAVTAAPASAFAFGTMTATPNQNLVNGQAITVKVSGFTNDPDGTVLYVVECSPLIVTQQDPSDCDQVPAEAKNPTTVGGAATAVFHVLTGSSFHPTKPGLKCDFQNPCDIVATDGKTLDTTNYAAFAPLTFKDPRAVTKTTVKGKKSLKAGASLKLTAKTAGSKPTGTVVFKDGSKTIAKVAEKSSGVAKATEKKLKAGTHHITVSYSGDANNRPSVGKLTVKVK